MTTDDTPVRRAFLGQAAACRTLGSPFTAGLLERAAGWLDSGHPVARRLAGWPSTVEADAVPLRFSGALHAAVLSGKAPGLAAHYPGHGAAAGAGFGDEAWEAALAILDAEARWIDDFLDRPPQTNEVGRASAVMAGALVAASRPRMPLFVLEAGASAGLNLAFDRYRHVLAGVSYGRDASPLALEPEWRGAPPPIAAAVEVAGRRAVDATPIDLADEGARLALRAYVWPDQPERLARADAAIAVARLAGLAVERGAIGNWVPEVLAEPQPGCLTFLFHTIVWQYVSAYERALAEAAIEARGRMASETAPFARLAIEWEPAVGAAAIRLTEWPGGHTRLLGHMHAHGAWIEWLG